MLEQQYGPDMTDCDILSDCRLLHCRLECKSTKISSMHFRVVKIMRSLPNPTKPANLNSKAISLLSRPPLYAQPRPTPPPLSRPVSHPPQRGPNKQPCKRKFSSTPSIKEDILFAKVNLAVVIVFFVASTVYTGYLIRDSNIQFERKYTLKEKQHDADKGDE